jgi:hypothetical protein
MSQAQLDSLGPTYTCQSLISKLHTESEGLVSTALKGTAFRCHV